MASVRCSRHTLNIVHWRIPCFYNIYNILPCYHPRAVFEVRMLCLARKIPLSQTCFWAPKMRPSLVAKTRPRSLRKTLWNQHLGNQAQNTIDERRQLSQFNARFKELLNIGSSFWKRKLAAGHVYVYDIIRAHSVEGWNMRGTRF